MLASVPPSTQVLFTAICILDHKSGHRGQSKSPLSLVCAQCQTTALGRHIKIKPQTGDRQQSGNRCTSSQAMQVLMHAVACRGESSLASCLTLQNLGMAMRAMQEARNISESCMDERALELTTTSLSGGTNQRHKIEGTNQGLKSPHHQPTSNGATLTYAIATVHCLRI